MSTSLLMTEDEARAHAGRALTAFKTLISTIYQPLLRAVTGNKNLRVVPSATTSATDAKTVWLMTPWVLGETQEHDRALCNKRDPQTLHMLCPACDVRDQTSCVVFHESSHITADSFKPVDVETVRELARKHLPWVDADALKLPRYINGKPANFAVIQVIDSVFLPSVFNAVEDIYVNRRLFEHRVGVEPSFQRLTLDTFLSGFRQADGTHIDWSKQPVDRQAFMAAYLVGVRLPHLVDSLCPEVKEIKDDPGIKEIMEAIPVFSKNVEDRIDVAFRALARLRELGFCIPPSQKEPEPVPTNPPPPPPQGDDPQPPQGDPSPSGGGEEDDDDAPSGDAGDSEDDEGDGESTKDDDDAQTSGKGGDESDEESGDEKPSDEDDVGDGEAGDDDDKAGDDDGEAGDDDAKQGEGDAGDSDDKDEEGDDAGDQTGLGDGTQGDDYDDPSGQAGPTPEELDQQAAEEMAKFAKQMFGHSDPDEEDRVTEPEDGLKPHCPVVEDHSEDLENAIKWEKFDSPPKGINDFFEVEDPKVDPYYRDYTPIDFEPGLVTGETARLRGVFAINRKRRISGSLKAGPKLDVPNLHRIGQDDFRIFGRQDRPDKRDWFVLVGLDDSSSTHGNGAAEFIREMALAVGEMLNGCGIRFAMYGHGGVGVNPHTNRVDATWKVRHLVVKGPDEAWTPKCKDRIQALGRDNCCNYDGHTLEQYRKIITKRHETDKMILYFTDGKMPMMNYEEEEEILKRELQILRQNRVNIFGVGYRTDSPKIHGIDTVEVKDGRDLGALVDGLRQRLEKFS